MSGLVYRSASAGFIEDQQGADWPAWVRKLRGKSGVYVIRAAGVVLYVGESHTGRLYDTLTRHFQRWSGRTAGAVYPRSAVEIAVQVMPAAKAVERQNALIYKLQPRDNTLSPDGPLDNVPF